MLRLTRNAAIAPIIIIIIFSSIFFPPTTFPIVLPDLKKKFFFSFLFFFLPSFFSSHIYLGFGRQHFSCSLGRGNHSFLFDFLFHFYRLFMYILVCLRAYLLFHRINDNEMRLFKKRIFLSKCLIDWSIWIKNCLNYIKNRLINMKRTWNGNFWR